MSKKVIVAGAGFSGMSLAAHLAKNGFEVEIYEKNESPGGKVRLYVNNGFVFDMGASVYFYPEIFERFFNKFNHSAADFYSLTKLNPSYRVFFNQEDFIDIPAENEKLLELCGELEPNGDKKMVRYLQLGKDYYLRFLDETLADTPLNYNKHFKYSWLGSVTKSNNHQKYIRNQFTNDQLISLLEFPLPFLGIAPVHSPLLPFAINYSLLERGIYYPVGGMHQVEEAFASILEELKVPIHLSSEVKHFDVIGDSISGILTHQKNFHADLFASAMDYYYTEQLIGKDYRNYSNTIWKPGIKYPSILIFYLGINKKLNNLQHHNLIFIDCFDLPRKKAIKFKSNYKSCLSFITCTSKTDLNNAPKGMENVVARISIPPGLEDTGKMREHYFTMLLNRLEDITGQSLKEEIMVKKSFAINDFENDYHSFKGQAFGALNSLRPSIFWSPKIRNRHLSNLYYAELPNVMGPGIASAILNGEIIANTMIRDYNKKYN